MIKTTNAKYLREHIHKNVEFADQHHDTQLVGQLLQFGKLGQDEVLGMLKTSRLGLSPAAAHKRLKVYGLNEIAAEKPTPWWLQLVQAFITPFTLILIVLAGVSFVTDVLLADAARRNWAKIVIIGVMVGFSGGIRFWQEFRSQKAAQALKHLVQNKASVVRQNASGTSELVVTQLVPGDIIHLSAGDMVPADVRLLVAEDLFVSQSALTGESMPVEKYAAPQPQQQGSTDPLELNPLCFTGTTVVSGTAMAVVVATGNHTYLGALAKQVTAKRPMTSFDKGVNGVGVLLIRFMFVMVLVVFIINGLTKGDWQEALIFSVAVAVGLTPELLPVVVTANLAKGAIRMGRKMVIIKRLNAIQNFGAMDTLCTDKTGTLTENRIALVRYLNPEGQESNRVLELAYVNSSLQTGLKNLLDQALLAYHDGPSYQGQDHTTKYKKVDEIPFDFSRRRMSVIVEDANGGRMLVCKGAVEELLQVSALVEQGEGQPIPINSNHHKKILQLTKQLNSDGLRVIAVGYKQLEGQKPAYHPEDESGLTIAGFIGFLDPPKASAKEALRQLLACGIQTKIITGDNDVVTAKICHDVGFVIKGILLGEQIQSMDDNTLEKAVENANIFAKVDPLQKARIITAMRANGHTVGYMGDGVNDAAAMRQSDVGISVDGGVDIAKEAADIILLKHDLLVLKDGVIEGRTVFGNIMKYIKMTASSNFGNVFSVLVASAFLPFLPMLPIHLLIQNLLYDISQFSIPWDNMDSEFLEKPRKWEAAGIARFMVFIGPISSIFDITTFLVMWFVFQANNPGMQSLFQSGWFVEGLLSQTLIVHMIRTQRIPFIQGRASKPVLLLTGLVVTFGVALPFTSVGAAVGLQALPLAYFPWLVGTILSYCVLTQFIKMLYIRRFNTWL